VSTPLEGKSCVVGLGHTGKVPLKESDQEIYNRIQKVKTKKVEKDDKRYINLLKKTGKVGTIALYMFDI
jgi:hypothetical protein